MKRFVRLVARLYPSSWRHRYGAEFDALLEDAGSGWRDAIDVLGGAISMQISMWSFRNVTVACGLLGVIVGAVWAFSLPDTYVSRAIMRMESQGSEDQRAQSRKVARIIQEALSRSSLSSIIQRPDLDLYNEQRRREPLEDVIETMKRKDIKVELVGNGASGTAFFVSFRYPDRMVAQKTTSALVAKLVDANQRIAINNPDRASTSLDLLDPASLPQNPTAPNRRAIVLVALVLGLLTGVLVFGARRWPVIAACGLAGLVLGWTAYSMLPKTWVSNAVLRTNAPQRIPDLTTKVLSGELLGKIIESENLYPNARRHQPIQDVIGNMRNRDLKIEAIRADSSSQPTAIVISFRYVDRYKTQHVVLDITNALFREANKNDASVAPNRPLEFLDAASLPEQPISPNRPVVAGVGMGLGLFCGFIATCVAWVRRRRQSSLPAQIFTSRKPVPVDNRRAG